MNANSNLNSLMTHMFQRLLEDQKKKKKKRKEKKKKYSLEIYCGLFKRIE